MKSMESRLAREIASLAFVACVLLLSPVLSENGLVIAVSGCLGTFFLFIALALLFARVRFARSKHKREDFRLIIFRPDNHF
ncbi:MAG: hypothetical protein EBS05_09950 [Proteobacteria bacterium]|nr:hypothetical protein [Pseudomonadota bacterium]